MNVLQALPTVVSVIVLAFLAFLVVHNQSRRANVLFACFIGVDTLWLASVYLVNFTLLGRNVYLSKVIFSISIALVMTVLAFLDSLLHIKRHKLITSFLYCYGVALATLTIFSNSVIAGVIVSRYRQGLEVYPVYGEKYWLFPVYLAATTLIVFVPVLVRKTTTGLKAGMTRQQLTSVRIGLILFTGLSILTNLVLPTAFQNSWPSSFAPLGSIALAVAFFYAITKYRLFDIRFVAVRAAAYLTTLAIITFVFIAPFVLIINHLLGQSISGNQFVLVLFLSAALLYILQFLRRFFDKLTTAVFFRNYYDAQDVLDRLSNALVRAGNLKILRESTANVLKDALKPEFVHYVLFRDDADSKLVKNLDEYSKANSTDVIDAVNIDKKKFRIGASLLNNDIAFAIRLHTNHEDMGFIVLGYKRSGELYTERDARLLSIAADEIAISLQNMLRFEEIQRFNLTLQEEVDAATAKLRRTNKRLEELDNIKDDFISMASHQLRTPLTSVKGYLSMVLEGDAGTLNPTQTQMLKQAFTSSQRMVFLITDLLNVSRLKTGKFVIDKLPVDLVDIVEQELAQLQEGAAAKGLTLTFQKPKAFPELLLDEVKIRQVIMNFTDNAIYYTQPGGRIRVELVNKPETVEMRVVDTGIGVPKGEQHHLFTKFYRATNARTARPDGTGLGLFMAQKVIAAQGGTIIFSSEENKGSTFGFAFSKTRLAVPPKTEAKSSIVAVAAEPKTAPKLAKTR